MWLRNGAVLVAGALAAVACSSPPVPPAHSLSTGDGLRLGFDREGRVTAVAVGGDELRVGAPGGFSVRAAGGTPNLLPDPGFEADGDADGVPDGWAFSSDGPAPVLERGAAHAGDASVRVASSSFGSTGAVEAVVDVRPYTHYVVSAWMRGEGIQPTKTPTSFSPARLVVEQLTGRVVVGTSYAFGYTDTSGWNRQFVGLQTGGGVNHLRLRGLIERGSGTLWFDDLSVGE